MIKLNLEKPNYNIYDDLNEDIALNDGNDIENEEIELINSFSNSILKKKTKYRIDNIRSKIMNHFSNFIINFLNDYAKRLFNYEKVVFVKTNYNARKNVDIKSISEFMNRTIKQFCSLKISSKIKRYPSNHNIEALNQVENDLGSNFLNQKLSEFYEKYYLNDDILKDYNLSDTTKNFSILLKENNVEQKYFEKLYNTGMTLVTEFIHKKRKRKESEDKELDSVNTGYTINDYASIFFPDSNNNFYDYDINLENLNLP